MRHTLVVAFFACVACDDRANETDPFAALTMDAIEELRVGSPDDPEAAFTWFRGLQVGPNGTIYTSHPQENQIRMHDASGDFLGSIGRRGQGPGEFERVGTMAVTGDTLWVLDHGLYRFSYFDLRGHFLGTSRIPIELGNTRTELPPRPNGLLRDGTLVASPPAFSRLVASGELTENYIVRMDSAGNTGDTIAVFSLVNTVWEITNSEQGRAAFGAYRPQPFSDAEIVTVSPYDMSAVRVTRSQPEPNGAAVFTVTKWRIDGDTVFSRAYPYQPIPLRTEMADSIVDSFAASVADSDFLSGQVTHAQAATWARQGLYLPTYHPTVSQMVVGADGTLWLRAEELGDSVVAWRILSAAGAPIGTVELPAGFQMMYGRGMQVWGTESDELDVPYIVRYRIEQTAETE